MDYMENYRRIPKVQNDADYKLDKILSEDIDPKSFTKRLTFHEELAEAARLLRRLTQMQRHGSRRIKSYIRYLMKEGCTTKTIIMDVKSLRRFDIRHEQAKTLQKRKGK